MIHVSRVFSVRISNPCANKKRHPLSIKCKKRPKSKPIQGVFHFYLFTSTAFCHSSSSKTLRSMMYAACVFVRNRTLLLASYPTSDCGE